MQNTNKQPIIILGGFLINPSNYKNMAEYFIDTEKINAQIINVTKFEWLQTSWAYGWLNILDKVEKVAKELTKESHTGKLTLIGHSSGGVMLRLFLSQDEFNKRTYRGSSYCNHLITLGSPHQALRATRLRALVDIKYPGSFYSKEVKYTSVAGNLNLKSPEATLISKKFALNSYKSISGQESIIGDGLVPLTSSLLKNSEQIILNNVAHGKFFGKYWYGSKTKVNLWWDKAKTNN